MNDRKRGKEGIYLGKKKRNREDQVQDVPRDSGYASGPKRMPKKEGMMAQIGKEERATFFERRKGNLNEEQRERKDKRDPTRWNK